LRRRTFSFWRDQRIGIEIEDNAKGVFLLKVRLKKGNENEGTFYPEVSNHDGA
jgi:hypothetical protein